MVILNLIYILKWEFEINAIFSFHNCSERQKVKVAVGTFTGFAIVWWSEHCRLYPDYVPTTWDDLKVVMREIRQCLLYSWHD